MMQADILFGALLVLIGAVSAVRAPKISPASTTVPAVKFSVEAESGVVTLRPGSSAGAPPATSVAVIASTQQAVDTSSFIAPITTQRVVAMSSVVKPVTTRRVVNTSSVAKPLTTRQSVAASSVVTVGPGANIKPPIALSSQQFLIPPRATPVVKRSQESVLASSQEPGSD